MPSNDSEVRALVRRGWAQSNVGALLAAGVGAVALNLAPDLLRPGADSEPSIGSGVGPLPLGALGLIVVFGLTTLANGCWLIRTGRRNPWLLRIAFGLLVLVVLAGWSLRKALLG